MRLKCSKSCKEVIKVKKEFSIFAQNLAYYNEGRIEGGWIDLPQSPEVIDRYLREVVKVDSEHEEYEIADIDNIRPFPYPSINMENTYFLWFHTNISQYPLLK